MKGCRGDSAQTRTRAKEPALLHDDAENLETRSRREKEISYARRGKRDEGRKKEERMKETRKEGGKE